MSNYNKAYYLTSIDGLRALAVSLVLLFHIDVDWMKGGFIGVDIFFVISGFLITTNIVRDIDNRQWQFSTFYTKRIARLFPALFIVILITTITSYFILTPDGLIRLSEATLYTLFSISNFFFFNESGYFDSSAITKPLLHTWSLSVEEQFYLVWPLTIFLLLSYGSRKILRNAIIAISIISIVAAIALNPSNPEMVFFITPFRAYQFGIGALIALSGITLLTLSTKTKTIIGLLSVLCILALSTSITGDKHILLIAILPALAAGGFIIAAETTALKSIFSSAPLVWIGQRSYSIYLVHWPLIVLWKISNGPELNTIEKLSAIVLSILGGYLLHSLVEKRFRLNNRTIHGHKLKSLATTSALFIFIITISILYSSNQGYPDRYPKSLIASASNLKPHWDIRQVHLRTGTCNILIGKLGKQDISNFDTDICIKPKSSSPSYLVIGDSYASGAYLIFKAAYPEANLGQLTIPGCRLIPVTKINNKVCAELFAAALNNPEFLQNYDGIIITSNWSYQNFDDLEELVTDLKKLDKKIIMVGQRIRFNERLPTIVLSSFSQEEASTKANQRLLQTQFKLNNVMKTRFSSHVKYIDMIELQCNNGCDIFTRNGEMMYLDDSHYSIGGASILAKRLSSTHPDLLK